MIFPPKKPRPKIKPGRIKAPPEITKKETYFEFEIEVDDDFDLEDLFQEEEDDE